MEQKVVLVTGASSGLGRAMAVRFRREGFMVIGVCRHCPEETVVERWIEADLTTAAGRDRVVEVLSREVGRLDVLINNAGKGNYATWEELTEEELRALFELDFFAPVLLTGKLLPLLEQSGGTIINIASVAGKMHVPCMGAYCAGKAAMILYSDSLRPELVRRGIRVLCVLPGRIDTGFSSRAFGRRQPPETPGGGRAEVLAERVITAYRRGRRRLFYPGWYRLALLIPKLLPGLYDRKNIELWHL
ncbi:MAG: SDR family NAD(P)-dependent oxidoreductase [Victivallales bacterium]|nr:SDR family NAD(P)-dependent oxidoreductase [Victivallales bacterium]